MDINLSKLWEIVEDRGAWRARLPCPSPAPRIYPNSCPLSWWCHPIISPSVFSFFSCLQSLPASGSFPISCLFTSGGQSIGVSASASILPMNIQDWFPLGLTGLISLQSKGLSRVFSSTTVQKHQFLGCSAFFMVQLWSPAFSIYLITSSRICLMLGLKAPQLGMASHFLFLMTKKRTLKESYDLEKKSFWVKSGIRMHWNALVSAWKNMVKFFCSSTKSISLR